MIRTADNIDHGSYRVEVCIWAMVERYEDGYVLCPLLATEGGNCEECYEIFEKQLEEERANTTPQGAGCGSSLTTKE